MWKLYKKNEILFSVLCIVVYLQAITMLRNRLGSESGWEAAALAALALGITLFLKAHCLEKKHGLTAWPRDTGKYLYFIPLWILATGNLWGGFAPLRPGWLPIRTILSMLLVGYIEEMLFRGLLFKALIPKKGVRASVLISSAVFGLAHLINLFAGQTVQETALQVLFAVSWGVILALVFCKCGSLLPGIAAHGLVNAFSRLGAESAAVGRIYTVAAMAVAILYGLYLAGLDTPGEGDAPG